MQVPIMWRSQFEPRHQNRWPHLPPGQDRCQTLWPSWKEGPSELDRQSLILNHTVRGRLRSAFTKREPTERSEVVTGTVIDRRTPGGSADGAARPHRKRTIVTMGGTTPRTHEVVDLWSKTRAQLVVLQCPNKHRFQKFGASDSQVFAISIQNFAFQFDQAK